MDNVTRFPCLLLFCSTELLDRDVKQAGATDGCLVRCQGRLSFLALVSLVLLFLIPTFSPSGFFCCPGCDMLKQPQRARAFYLKSSLQGP